jgi:hypothetical protein
MEGWTLIFSDAQPFSVELRKNQLDAAGIQSLLLNKRDSSYGMFGPVELWVPSELLAQASGVLSTSEVE